MMRETSNECVRIEARISFCNDFPWVRFVGKSATVHRTIVILVCVFCLFLIVCCVIFPPDLLAILSASTVVITRFLFRGFFFFFSPEACRRSRGCLGATSLIRMRPSSCAIQ